MDHAEGSKAVGRIVTILFNLFVLIPALWAQNPRGLASQIPEILNVRQPARLPVENSPAANRIANPSLYAVSVLHGLPNEEISIVDINDIGDRAVLRRTIESRTSGRLRITLLKRTPHGWDEHDLLSRSGGDFWTDPALKVEPVAMSVEGKYLVYTSIKPHFFFSDVMDLILAVLNMDSGEPIILKNLRAGELSADMIPNAVAGSEWFHSNYPDETYDGVFRRSPERCLAPNNPRASVEGHRNLMVRKEGAPTLILPLNFLPGVTAMDWDEGWNRFNSADCSMGLMTVRSSPSTVNFQTYVMDFGLRR